MKELVMGFCSPTGVLIIFVSTKKGDFAYLLQHLEGFLKIFHKLISFYFFKVSQCHFRPYNNLLDVTVNNLTYCSPMHVEDERQYNLLFFKTVLIQGEICFIACFLLHKS